MRAELKSLSSVDVDLRTYAPPEDAFCVEVTAEVGALGEKGADMFQFEVCSPEWLQRELQSETIVSGRHRLFMSRFSYDALEAYVLKRVRQAEGPDGHPWRRSSRGGATGSSKITKPEECPLSTPCGRANIPMASRQRSEVRDG